MVLEGVQKFGEASSNDEKKTNLKIVNFAFYKGFLDLIQMVSSDENIVLARKRKFGPK